MRKIVAEARPDGRQVERGTGEAAKIFERQVAKNAPEKNAADSRNKAAARAGHRATDAPDGTMSTKKQAPKPRNKAPENSATPSGNSPAGPDDA